MKFLLALILVFSAAFDVCVATPLFQVENSESQSAASDSCCISDQINSAENAEEHKSHEHENHDFCQQCHTCQQLISVRVSQGILSIDTLKLETPYQFYIPSTFIKSLKRPPKV